MEGTTEAAERTLCRVHEAGACPPGCPDAYAPEIAAEARGEALTPADVRGIADALETLAGIDEGENVDADELLDWALRLRAVAARGEVV